MTNEMRQRLATLASGLASENKTELIEAIVVLIRTLDNDGTMSNFAGTDFDNEHSRNHMLIESLGAPKKVVQSMIRQDECAEIQKLGCQALALMSYCGYENEIIALGGVERAVRAMSTFPDVPEVITSTCELLASLISDKASMEIVVQAGGLDAIVATMYHSEDSGIQHYAMLVLRIILEEGGVLAALYVYNTDACDEVISAMLLHDKDELLQLEGCKILQYLAETYPGCSRQIILSNGMSALSEAIRIHGGDAEISAVARRAVGALLGYHGSVCLR